MSMYFNDVTVYSHLTFEWDRLSACLHRALSAV
jgi:hypothetical protein